MTKTELEELGESTEDVLSTSKLQSLVKAYTDVDIMKSATEYKDIYTIVSEIGEKWKKLKDVERAALLEALAGKKQSNTLAAVLNNADRLKEIYETAESSAGSAQREQEKYAQSLQYSFDQLTAHGEEFWKTFINNDDVKLFIDLINKAISGATKFVDIAGTIPTVAGIAGTLLANKSGADLIKFDPINKSWGGLFMPSRPKVDNKIADFLNNKFNPWNSMVGGIDQAKALDIDDNNLFKFFDELEAGNIQLNKSKTYLDAYTKYLKGVEKGSKPATAGTKALSGAMKVLSSIGWMALITAITWGIQKGIEGISNYVNRAEISRQKLEEVKEELNNTSGELNEINKKISEIQSKGKLSLTDQTELQKLQTEKNILEDQVRLLELKKELAEKKSNSDAVSTANSMVKGFGWKSGLGFYSDYAVITEILGMTLDGKGGTLEQSHTDLKDINKKISKETDTKKLTKLYEKKLDIQADIDKSKTDLSSVYLSNLELIEQITGNDPASKAAREKLETQNEIMEKYLFSAEELAQKGIQKFKSKFAARYNEQLNAIQRDDSHKKSTDLIIKPFSQQDIITEEENFGIGGTGVSEVEIDGLVVTVKELNKSFVDGKIDASEYFSNISKEIDKIDFDDIGKKLKGGKGENETTDYLEQVIATLTAQVSDAMSYSAMAYNAGEMSVGEYIDTLNSGMDAQKKLLKSTYDLTESEDGLIEAVDKSDKSAVAAAESFNKLAESQKELVALDEFADNFGEIVDKMVSAGYIEGESISEKILGDPALFGQTVNTLSAEMRRLVENGTYSADELGGKLQQSFNISKDQISAALTGAKGDLETLVGNNLSAINAMEDIAADNASKTITNASQTIGRVLEALGTAIQNFDYTIEFSPFGAMDFKKDIISVEDGKVQLNLPSSFGFNIKGSGGSSIQGVVEAVQGAVNYFSSSGSTPVDSILDWGTVKDTGGTTNNTSGSSSAPSGTKKDKSADDSKKAEEERIKKENEAFKEGLETRKKILERYKSAIDLTDFGLDITEEGDFSTRADLLNNKMSQITSYGEAMRKEFDRVTKIIPKTGEQADALASHIQSLGGDIRENVKLLRETRVAMEKLKIDSVVSVGDYYLEDLTSVLDDIESRIDRLSNDNNDDYEYTNKILNMKALLPTRSGTKNVRNERRGADHDVIQAEQETQDAINDIIETQIRKNEKLREDERTAILNELQELRANTQIKLTEFQDDVSNSCDIVTARIDATDVQFPEPSIDFSKAEKQFDDFGKVTDRLSNKAADLADSLAQIAIACGETPPNPLPRYATGTPNGNAKTKNLGIAGENYKPEILVDKATGKTTYIDKPTVFDLSTTDVIGEKATNSIPKFAKGTINPNYDKRPFNKRLEEFEARVSDWLDAHSGVGYPFEQIYPISSPYGIRVHPVTGQIRMHTGVDFGAGLGTKILSTTFGTVETSSWYGGYGNCVIIRELNGNRWLYGHMVEPSHLRPGDRIRRGELVGYVGSTGVSTGPHLHLERMPANGGYTDPLPYLPYYEAGTPDGNAKARRFGIAGENFKPEILIDKATGKTTYIDKPTVFDLSTTDVIGEKATAGMSKFATGTPTTDETVRKIIKQVCDEYGVPYEVALAVLDRESGNVIKLTANPDGDSYSHTSWQLYDYGVWADVSKADKDFINKAAEQGESGENFYEAFAIATKYAISDLAQNYKSTGSWQGALGKYNGSGTYGSYAKEVIKASNSAPFKEAAKALGDNTDALETNTTAIETDNDKKLTPEEEAVKNIQSFVDGKMVEINHQASRSTAQTLLIEKDESLSDEQKAIELFKVLSPTAKEGSRIGYESYEKLLSQFIEWWNVVEENPKQFSQATFDAYIDGLDKLEDATLSFEETLASSREKIIDIMDKSLSEIDDYIDERNDKGSWALFGETEADAIRRKKDVLTRYREDDFLSPEEYEKRMKALTIDEADAEYQHSQNWIDERNKKGDWALYGDSEYEAWQRVAKWLREKYPDELDKIHEADQNAIDAKYQHSQNWIDERNAYNDWALFDDTEVDAWERVVKWLHEDYPNDINKLKEAEKNLFEARKKELNDATTFGNSYLESQKTLLQAHYGVENAIAEARHEINKELATSKTMYEYLDEDSRELLFNQEDYNKLRKELNTIENKSLDLQSEYESKLKGATLETIESITSEYQIQYETLMKSYEIAKADLEIAKKKQKLNNVLAERNVRMFVNGSWQWVANTKDVADAQSELADAKYAKQVEEAGLTQKQSIDDLTRQQNELSLVVKEFEGGVTSLDEAVKKAGKAIKYIPQAMMDMLNNAKVDTKAYSQGSSSRSSNGVWYDSNYSLDSQQDNNSKSTGGLTLMGEFDDELYISSHGRLIPITQPTIGNIPSGGAVFNKEQMKNIRTLWDMSNLNLNGIDFMGGVQHQQTSHTYDNRIIINGMTVDNGSADGQALISALQRYVGNH